MKIGIAIFTIIGMSIVGNSQSWDSNGNNSTVGKVTAKEFNFPLIPKSFSDAPRQNISPMTMRLWDNYDNGGPTTYGTLLEIYGRSGHQTSQLYFGGWDSSRIKYREAFYNQSEWSDWITLLDSKNDVQSKGNLKISGSGNHLINGALTLGGELTFPLVAKNFSDAPRQNISSMSIRLWDNYRNGGPSTYGTLLEIYGRSGHQTSQLYFGGWDSSRIKYREAFYNQNEWSEWITLLDSKNDVESKGDLKISGSGNHYISNGKLGIGTITTGKHTLAVEGSIGAREIKVEAFPNWSDFVFEKNYNLPTLIDVEAYIKEKGHLKDIPSGKEVANNGFFLGEMNSKLLQKIEELTLYTIQQEKEIVDLNKLKAKVKILEKENKSFKTINTKLIVLQKRLEKLENN